MPRIQVEGKQYDGWQPLPNGTYDVTLNKVEETTSKNNNPQLKISGEVADGPHAGKKVTLWYSLTEKSIWKLADLCEAAGVGDVIELPEIDPETGKPRLKVDLDTDELMGCMVRYDVSTRQTPDGKQQNDFTNERSPKEASASPNPSSNGSTHAPAPAAGANAGAAAGAAQSAPAAAGAAPQQAAAAGGGRRRRTV